MSALKLHTYTKIKHKELEKDHILEFLEKKLERLTCQP
jgi:hypothetical protein